MDLNCSRANRILKRLNEIQPERNTELSEIGFAKLFAEVSQDEFKYNVDLSKYMCYDGIRWVEDEGNIYAAQQAKDLYDCLKLYTGLITDDHLYKPFSDTVFKYSNCNKREILIKDARSFLAVRQSDFDKNSSLLNCSNGTLDLKTYVFHSHTPKDMLTKVCGCEYNPMANSSFWEQFIDQVMQEDNDKIMYIKRICGYFITADTNLEIAFILYGPTTRNGKSTLLETLGKVLGEYYSPLSPSVLASTKYTNSEAPSPQIAKLSGVRLASISEPPKEMPLNVAMLKCLTGGDKITARKLNSSPFDFIPQFKLCFNCNSLPVVADRTLFYSNRVRIIPFNRHFKSGEQNLNLKRELSKPEVLSSVLNWAIEGLKDLRENGECPPESVLFATETYKVDSDKISKFFNDCMHQSKVNTSGEEVYKAYCDWCVETGYSVDGKFKFFDSLRERNLLRQGTVQGKTVKNAVIGYSISA